MRVSTTERQTYKRCRRKWDYTSYNRQSLSPVVNAPALDLGTVIHKVLADWTADPSLDPVAHYKNCVQEYFQSLIDAYKQRIGCAPSVEELKPTMEAMGLGQDMIANYKERWGSALPPGFSLVANELTLIQPVPGTEHCGCLSSGPHSCDCIGCILYEGARDVCGTDVSAGNYTDCSCLVCHELECTFDGVMADANGLLYIIERKTFSRTPSLEELNNNDQFLAYQWALSKHMPGKVVGVAYDGLLKKPKPSGVHKSLEDLFLRRILLRNEHELTEFEQLLALELNEMANNPPIYKTVPPVMGCQRWECSFLDLCHAQSKGEPTRDLLRMFVRSERKSHLEEAVDV